MPKVDTDPAPIPALTRPIRSEDRVLHGDCLNIMPTLPLFDLVFADPPFNIDQNYQEFKDVNPDYSKWTWEWLDAAWARTKGVMAIHGPDHLMDILILWANTRGVLGKRIAWVNWHYQFGQCTSSNWVDGRCHLMIFANNPKKHTWNPDSIRVKSLRATEYHDKRIHDTEKGGTRVPCTVWGIPIDGQYWGRVTGNSEERRPDHPNQLPERYLERVILAYTNQGDLVLDPFGGSGTTMVVAEELKRVCYTIETSKMACASIRDRLKKGTVRVKLGN